jgi:hypothetical protein
MANLVQSRTEATEFVVSTFVDGYRVQVTKTVRTGSPLMALEFMVFVGHELVGDEFETPGDAHAYAHAYVACLAKAELEG